MIYNFKADMWSLGILLGQLCSVDVFYPYGNSVTWENIREQVRCTFGGIAESSVAALGSCMLHCIETSEVDRELLAA